ncbi:MAG: cyclic nucleotide-binding domain-containing protein [Alphaproteobacteria bacterium]|jgi:voltage-gated potassium channel|nr:cyclic nucleotide-binding domain-containing protein [Alphaproteobacteria bacterium]
MSEPDRRHGLALLRRRVHVILDGGSHDHVARIVHRALIGLVLLSVVSVIFESVPEYGDRYSVLFDAIEYVAVAAFTLEYILRVWCAPEHALYAHRSPTAARIAFIKSGWALVDLAAFLPFYFSFYFSSDLRIFLMLRLLRFFKFARYSPGIRTLLAVIEAERKALLAWLIILFGAVLFYSTAMHLAEHEAQPEKFGTIPDAMWWAIETVTTVGYGEVIPLTLAGKLIASFAMVTGFLLLALPVGILATAFAEEIHRREFVVTWTMVASVPLFRALNASAIAEIMRYLRAQSIPRGALIVRKGDPAHSMYFIAEGEVEVELPHENVRLGEGQFFGEMAVLQKTSRSADVRATAPTKLLVLDAYDLQTLTNRNPEVGNSIREVAQSRSELAPAERHGDIIEAELEEPAAPEEISEA